jgi:hypothetical protein
LCKHLEKKGFGIMVGLSDTENNVQYALCEAIQDNPDHQVVMFHLTRGASEARDFDASSFFSTVENAMSGTYETHKFRTISITTEFKHVVVFSNEPPKPKWLNGQYLSKGRWHVRPIAPLSPADRQIIEDAKVKHHQDTGKRYGPPPDLD